MKKIVLIIPWFGQLRNDFSLWLKSVEYNPTVDFLFFTDQEIASPPKNLCVVKTTLQEMQALARKNVWEGSVVSKPYKLCDFRPAYGEMFSSYIKDYDFWGHCDIDLVFGNIRHFITDDILDKYDRIGTCGHFTLYRNTPEVNSLYKQIEDYKHIFAVQRAFCFDEWGGTTIYWRKNLSHKFFQKKFYDDLDPYHYSFYSERIKLYGSNVKNVMFSYNHGVLYRYGTYDDGRLEKVESMYVHFQKRPMKIEKGLDTSRYTLLPPGRFIRYVENVTTSYLRWHVCDNKFHTYYIRLRNKLNKFLGKEAYSIQFLCPDESSEKIHSS